MLGMFLPVVRQTLREPREAAATLLSMGVPKPVLWPAFFLLIVLSVLFTFSIGAPVGPDGEVIFSPFSFLFVSVVAGISSVFLIWKIGALMGGKGGFDEALLQSVFLQGMMFAGQLVSVAVVLIVPPLSFYAFVALIGFMIWQYLNFTAVLHGFGSLWRAFSVLAIALICSIFVAALAMSLAGIRVAGVA